MAAGPQRKTIPAPHLLAPVPGIERALRYRAEVLGEEAKALAGTGDVSAAACDVKAEIAQQFRALADEFHHW